VNLFKWLSFGKVIRDVFHTKKNRNYALTLDQTIQGYISKQLAQPEIDFDALYSYSLWLEPRKGTERCECPPGLRDIVQRVCPEELLVGHTGRMKKGDEGLSQKIDEDSRLGKNLYAMLEEAERKKKRHNFSEKKAQIFPKRPTKLRSVTQSEGSNENSPDQLKLQGQATSTQAKQLLEKVSTLESQNVLLLNQIKELDKSNQILVDRVTEQSDKILNLSKQNVQILESLQLLSQTLLAQNRQLKLLEEKIVR